MKTKIGTQFKTVQHKITIAILFTSMIIAIIIGMFAISYSRKLLINESEKGLVWMAKSYAHEFSVDLELIEERVHELNHYIVSTIDYESLKKDNQYLEQYEKNCEQFFFDFARTRTDSFSAYVYFSPEWSETPHDIYFVDGDNDRIPDRQAYIPFSYYDQTPKEDDDKYWWYGPISEGKGVWTNPYEWTLVNDEVIKVVSYVEPVYVDGVFIGVVGSYYRFDKIFDVISSMKIDSTGYAVLYNEKFDFVVHPEYKSGTRFNSFNLKDIGNGKYKGFTKQMLYEDSGFINIKNDFFAYSTLSNGWILSINPSLAEVFSPVNDLIIGFLFIFLIGSIFIIFISIVLGKNISLSLQFLKSAIETLKQGNYTNKILKFSNDEIGDISHSFNEMSQRIHDSEQKLKNLNIDLESKVNERTENLMNKNQEIQSINNELSKTLLELEQTQEKLILSEKSVSISRLVNGIAHEINTPVGNGITLTTYSISHLNTLIQEINTENIEKEHLSDELVQLNHTYESILICLKKAAQLVANFKLISTKSTTYTLKTFDLVKHINEFIEHFTISTKHSKINFVNSCSDNLIVTSYPKVYSQILEQLLENTIQHGLDKQINGEIKITCFCHNEMVIIEFCDNGSGISEDKIWQIFEPFFTTNHRSKSIGLGLFMVSNLVTTMLNGYISCTSDFENGTCFRIEVPWDLKILSSK